MKIVCLFIALVLASCVVSQPFNKVKVNGKYEIMGASIYSPSEHDWYLIQYSKDSVSFGNVPAKNDSVIANLNIFRAGEFNDDQAFLTYIKSVHNEVQDKERWANIEIKNDFTTFKGLSCLSYKTESEDHKSNSKSNKSFQYFSTLGNICRHPHYKAMAVQLEISYRGDDKSIPPSILEVAQRFFDNFEPLNNVAE